MSSEFLLPQSRTTHFLLLELLSLSSPPLLCLNLRASGTVLACVHFWGGLLQELGRICVLWNWNKGVSFMAVPVPAVLLCSFPSRLLCCFTPRAVPCTFCGANQAGEKCSTSLNSAAHQFSSVQSSNEELNRCLFPIRGSQVGGCSHCINQLTELLPNLEPPQIECGLWVHSWVGIPAQKYEFPSKVVNSKVKICAVSILTVWLLIVLRDACKYPYSWIKA